MFKQRWTIRIKTDTQAIIIPCENEQLARLMASRWAREGYKEITIRRHAREVWEGLPALLVIVPIVIGIMVKLNG